MSDVTIWVPHELDQEMRAHSETDWRAIVRNAFRRELDRLHPSRQRLGGSAVTAEDAVRLGREIRRAMRGRTE